MPLGPNRKNIPAPKQANQKKLQNANTTIRATPHWLPADPHETTSCGCVSTSSLIFSTMAAVL